MVLVRANICGALRVYPMHNIYGALRVYPMHLMDTDWILLAALRGWAERPLPGEWEVILSFV